MPTKYQTKKNVVLACTLQRAAQPAHPCQSVPHHTNVPKAMSDGESPFFPRGRLGVAQMCSSHDKANNFLIASELCDEANAKGVDFLSFPECFAYMGNGLGASQENSEPLDGPLLGRYKTLAADKGIWLALGGFHEQGADDRGRIFNTHVGEPRVLLLSCPSFAAAFG